MVARRLAGAADAVRAGEQADEREALAEEARIRFETLRESVGAEVEELQQRLSAARAAVGAHEKAVDERSEVLRKAGEARARAEQKTEDAASTLDERSTARQAAVSSYYSQADTVHAPRLVLLDEAFAGIDDAARAHCMALIREFDLDFVITSEREWACYAALPGVAIAQLQRREDIDAVYVSRWTWDGRACRREDDPGRRFPPVP